MDAYFGFVLEAFAAGTLPKAAAVEEIAQAIAQVDTGRYGEASFRFKEVQGKDSCVKEKNCSAGSVFAGRE
jgi:hypothetical protein